MAIKELEHVKGWPYTEASLLFKDEVAEVDGTQVARIRDGGGGVLVGLTTASEIGFVNYTSTKLNGTTRNPWNLERTPGGSSGGAAAAVAGGLAPSASGADGGARLRSNRSRRRRGRLHPHSVRLLGPVRPQGDLRPRPARSVRRDRASDCHLRRSRPLGPRVGRRGWHVHSLATP